MKKKFLKLKICIYCLNRIWFYLYLYILNLFVKINYPLKSLHKYLIVLLVLLFVFKVGSAQKNDTIYHINGNILTGDFKKLDYGVVKWSMEGMGTNNFEEIKINKIHSKKLFEIITRDGAIYFGSLDTTKLNRMVKINALFDTVVVHIDEIVEIYPLKKSFWLRTTGTLGLGLNYSKGSDVGTIATNGNLEYRKQKWYYNFKFDANNTYQGDSLISNKWDISLLNQRLYKGRWSSGVGMKASQNSSLGSKLKLEMDILAIHDVIYNSWTRLYLSAGLNGSRQTPYSNTDVTNDVAGVFAAVWKVYKFSSPKISLDANFNYLPYFTSNNRYLIGMNINPNVNIINGNFRIGLKFYYNYDNKPPEGALEKTDYGFNLQFSYKFH